MLRNYCIPHYSDKVSWKGHFYPVRNENPLGEDSLPFCNLYTRNPIGLSHCAVEGLINLYPMERMSLINGFGCLSSLITWSNPLIVTAGSELGRQLPVTMHASGQSCMFLHICNYVHTWKPVVPAPLAVGVNWAAVGVNGLWCLSSASWRVESAYEFASVWQEGSNVPWGPQALLTLLQHQFNHQLVHVWHGVGCRWWAVATSEGCGCVQVTS